MWRSFVRTIVIAVSLGTVGVSLAEPPAQSIVLASATSIENSGLLAAILPSFTKGAGVSVRVLAIGTGQALHTARLGGADLVLVADPEAEQKFMEDGDGVSRRQIAWNDSIIVGPKSDPAHVVG